jgi:mRNA-degrading endonuclease toxin of MazEF toxin-antitoxin module
VTTGGEELPRRGEVWWVRVDTRRPAVVVQTDKVREPRVGSFLVVPLTSRLHLEGLPGTVRLDHAAGFSVFLTGDQNLEFQQNISKRRLGVVVLRAGSNALEDLLPLIPRGIDRDRSRPTGTGGAC